MTTDQHHALEKEPNAKVIVRKYQESDAKSLVNIYYHTIHRINCRDYTEEQVNSWAPPSSLDVNVWMQKWSKLAPMVATIQGQIVGFAELEPNGHIDCFYCHHEWISKGVGSQLMRAIETRANELHVPRLFAEVSITAKPFFIARGFHVVKEQQIELRGVYLTNFVMEKSLVKQHE